MIEVEIKLNGVPLGVIEILKITEGVTEEADYRVKYWVRRGSAEGLHNRVINAFPRKKINVFGLVLQALNALNEKDLKLERDYDPDEAPLSADLGRGLDKPESSFPAWFSRLHRN